MKAIALTRAHQHRLDPDVLAQRPAQSVRLVADVAAPPPFFDWLLPTLELILKA